VHRAYSFCMWKENSVVSERIDLITDYLSGDYAVSELSWV